MRRSLHLIAAAAALFVGVVQANGETTVKPIASWHLDDHGGFAFGFGSAWVAGGGVFSWYPDAAKRLKQRGNIVWNYGGTPTVQKVSADITLDPLRSWIRGVDGFVRWLTVSPEDKKRLYQWG